MTVSFIGRGNWSTQRKPLTCRKSLTSLITYYDVVLSTPRLIGIRTYNVRGNWHWLL